MIYGERIKYAREKLGMDRMTFAVVLGTTQENIRNIENCKDESKKLGWDKMKKLIAIAELPKGYFFYDNNEFQRIVLEGIAYSKGAVSTEEVEDMLRIAKRR